MTQYREREREREREKKKIEKKEEKIKLNNRYSETNGCILFVKTEFVKKMIIKT